MKFDCGKRTREQKITARNRCLKWWHPWFAWFPVWIGPHDCRWLEKVHRRGVYGVTGYTCHHDGGTYPIYGWIWDYKALPYVIPFCEWR